MQLLVWKQDIACSECEVDLSTSPLPLRGRLLLKEQLYLLQHLWAVAWMMGWIPASQQYRVCCFNLLERHCSGRGWRGGSAEIQVEALSRAVFSISSTASARTSAVPELRPCCLLLTHTEGPSCWQTCCPSLKKHR